MTSIRKTIFYVFSISVTQTPLQLPALLQNLIYLVTISTIHTLLTGTKFSIPPWYITHLSTCVHATPRNRSCSISAPRETGGETCKWTIKHHNKAKCQMISHFLGAKKVMSFFKVSNKQRDTDCHWLTSKMISNILAPSKSSIPNILEYWYFTAAD